MKQLTIIAFLATIVICSAAPRNTANQKAILLDALKDELYKELARDVENDDDMERDDIPTREKRFLFSWSCTKKCGRYHLSRLTKLVTKGEEPSYPSGCNCDKFAWEN